MLFTESLKRLNVFFLLLLPSTLTLAEPTLQWDGYGDPTSEDQLFISLINAFREDPVSGSDFAYELGVQDHAFVNLDTLEKLEASKIWRSKFAARPPFVHLETLSQEASSRLDYIEVRYFYDAVHREVFNAGSGNVFKGQYFLNAQFWLGPIYLAPREDLLVDYYLVAAVGESSGSDFANSHFYDSDGAGGYRSPSEVHSYVGIAMQATTDKENHDDDLDPLFNTLHAGATAYADRPFPDTIWITGTAYRDNNRNGKYDVGEGVSGLTVTPSRGDYFAVTATAGGYAIPFPMSAIGDIDISAVLGTSQNPEWETTISTTLESFSSRAGDGGMLLDFKVPFEDTDNDGLPDNWELEHFGSEISSENAFGDPDGDSQANFVEYYANTDPNDPNSKYTHRVEWNGVAFVEHERMTIDQTLMSQTLEYSLNLSEWTTLSGSDLSEANAKLNTADTVFVRINYSL